MLKYIFYISTASCDTAAQAIGILISSLWCRGECAALSPANSHTMPPEFDLNCETELSFFAVICAGYSVKLKKMLQKSWKVEISVI